MKQDARSSPNPCEPITPWQGVYRTIFTILLLLQLCPIWLTPYPAMHDYPNHLARSYILHQYNENSSYQATYERDWRPIPNLAMDLMLQGLFSVMSPEMASKSFLSLTILVFNIGLHQMGLAFNHRFHWNVLGAMQFTYNFTFSYGFVNYMFGLGLFFITLAAWFRFRSKWTGGRYIVVFLLTSACYFAHLSAFVFLAICLGLLTGIRWIRSGNALPGLVIDLLPLGPASLAYLWYSWLVAPRSQMIWWQPFLEKKLTGLLYPFLSYDLILDSAIGILFFLLFAALLKVRAVHLASTELCVLGGVFLLLYGLAPMSAGGTSYVDRRFLLPAVVFLLLGIRIAGSIYWARSALIGLLSIATIRGAEVWHYWNRIGQEIQVQVNMLKRLPQGAWVYPMVVHDKSSAQSWLWDMHFFFVPHYATLFRHAYVPTIYAWKGVHPLNLRVPETDYVQTEGGTSLKQIRWDTILTRYDYVWGYKLSEELRSFLLSEGDIVAQSENAILIRIGERPQLLGSE